MYTKTITTTGPNGTFEGQIEIKFNVGEVMKIIEAQPGVGGNDKQIERSVPWHFVVGVVNSRVLFSDVVFEEENLTYNLRCGERELTAYLDRLANDKTPTTLEAILESLNFTYTADPDDKNQITTHGGTNSIQIT